MNRRNQQEQVLGAYEKALKQLPGSEEKNREYRRYIRDSIQEVFASHPEIGEAEVRELMGDPETVRSSYIGGLDPEELERGRRERRKARNRRLAFLIPICLLLAFFTGLFVYIRFFSPTDIVIAYPADREAARYMERPMLIETGSFLNGIFGKSAKRILQERQFIDSVSAMEQELGHRYPGGYHITCTVAEEREGILVRWTGSGTTAEGVTEEVSEAYACPYRFRVRSPDALEGEAARRAGQAEEQHRRTIEALG